MESLQWSAFEYEEKEHSRDWFWAFGIIIVTASLATIIYANYFFAGLIILSGVLLGFFTIKKPELIDYELNEKGLKIKHDLYEYAKIKSFYIQIHPKNILFIKSNRSFMPIISIPIEPEMIEDIHSVFTIKNITEEEMREHPSEKIMEMLGF